jgi:phosphopantothenoylcysteine decarboxylase
MKILIGVTGSVAAIKLNELITNLKMKSPGVVIRVVLTMRGVQFVDASSIEADAVFTDEHEWLSWKQKGDPVLHIELRKWADVLLVAPLSANSLAKIANGLCDNLLTSIIRAWDRKKRMILCPAMNTFMWDNPLTASQLKTAIDTYKAEIVDPKEDYVLACGDSGAGAMADVGVICDRVLN